MGSEIVMETGGEKLLYIQPTDGGPDSFISSSGKGKQKIDIDPNVFGFNVQDDDAAEIHKTIPFQQDLPICPDDEECQAPVKDLDLEKVKEPKKCSYTKLDSVKSSARQNHKTKNHTRKLKAVGNPTRKGCSPGKLKIVSTYHPYGQRWVLVDDNREMYLLEKMKPCTEGQSQGLTEFPASCSQYPQLETHAAGSDYPHAFTRPPPPAQSQDQPMDLSTSSQSNVSKHFGRPDSDQREVTVQQQEVTVDQRKKSQTEEENTGLQDVTTEETRDKATFQQPPTPDPSQSFKHLSLTTGLAASEEPLCNEVPNLFELGVTTEDYSLPKCVGIRDQLRKKLLSKK